MDIFKRIFVAVVMTAACLVSVPVAYAQQSPAPSEQGQPVITDQELDQTAAAWKRLVSMKQSYKEQIAAAAPSDKVRIAQEWVQDFMKVVTEQGLSVEEYYTVLEVAEKDPAVGEKFEQRISPSADWDPAGREKLEQRAHPSAE